MTDPDLRIRADRGPAEHPVLVAIWASAVEATHAFLDPEDREQIRARLMPQYFPQVRLLVAERGGRPVGFAGIAGTGLEMLFVHADEHRRGIGGALLARAIAEHDIRTVDVNEQNPQATRFYAARGFEVVGRSPEDEAGRPYPILHLRRNPGAKP
ncbi:GNAT family N-acetyltransferase [Brachybacterium hainanense]|uniref:GNAT family N-acetyltransferase n=1 Tax=Brachybacterium hainanense TaxID=1541174 RepID=A0ABV6R7L8_9MICO